MTAPVTELTPADLAALMCARICHDLVSPVGALGTALEVLDDSDNVDMHEDALDVVRVSARRALGELQFLRLAFGGGGSAPGMVSVDTLKTLCAGKYDGGKIIVGWSHAGFDGLEKTTARLVLNLVMLAATCIPRGGNVKVGLTEKDDAVHIDVTATGVRARIDPMVKNTLSGKAPEDGFDGRSIQPFYTGMIIRRLKGRMDMSLVDDTASLSALIPGMEDQEAGHLH